MDLLLHLFFCVSWKTDVVRKVILFQARSKGFSIARFIIQVVAKMNRNGEMVHPCLIPHVITDKIPLLSLTVHRIYVLDNVFLKNHF